MFARCDLLENTYLCGSNNNYPKEQLTSVQVVICLKIRTFVVATTTTSEEDSTKFCCDLLENTYLCGSNNNYLAAYDRPLSVVICLKIRTFVVATTTRLQKEYFKTRL